MRNYSFVLASSKCSVHCFIDVGLSHSTRDTREIRTVSFVTFSHSSKEGTTYAPCGRLGLRANACLTKFLARDSACCIKSAKV